MILNDFGKIVNECWLEIPKHFPNTKLHEHVVMPNHIHGIIEITQKPVGAENFLPLQTKRHEFQKMIPKSIAAIVKGLKIGVTKWFRQNTDIHIVWQRNYHEHVIRDDKSYRFISEYIMTNPEKWQDDRFYAR